MINNEGKIKEKDIRKRALSFACRIVNYYRFLASQEGVGEVFGRQAVRSETSIGANLESENQTNLFQSLRQY
ncbi:MAG: hypothetical protein A2Z38_06560 [Planctomycetes bacterium RBG_19FT_COMBO_48_8]|nr:MAG: hypothetical protein A2Z38_06560 [Planctomycetes bacterium RBG_19FT_COMBO_48_8]